MLPLCIYNNIDLRLRWKMHFHFYLMLDNCMFVKNGVHVCLQKSDDKFII